MILVKPYKNEEYREVEMERSIEVSLEQDLFIKNNEAMDISFELDLDASRLEVQEGEEIFIPVFEAKISR